MTMPFSPQMPKFNPRQVWSQLIHEVLLLASLSVAREDSYQHNTSA